MFGHHPLMGHSSSSSSSHPQSSAMDLTSKVIQLTLLVLSLIGSMLLNGLVTYCLARKRRFASTAGNQFLFSMTLSNFINSVFSLPMLIAAGATDVWAWGAATCQISAFIHLLVGVNGNFTLAMIAYDRYHAIVKPLKYHQQISATRSGCMLAGGWIFSILITAAPFYGWSSFAYHPSLFVCSVSWWQHPIYALLLFVIAVLIPISIMFVCYTYVYLAARFQHYSIAHQQSIEGASTSMPSSPSLEINGGSPTIDDPLLTNSPTKLRHKLPWIIVTYSSPDKARRTLLILLFSYSVCWGAAVVWAACEISGRSSSRLAFVCYFLNSLSAVLNPLIYGFMNKSIRGMIRKMVCKRRVGRRGTGGRRRRKRTKAISLHPPSSIDSSPSHSTTNSFASFFDYSPRRAGSPRHDPDGGDQDRGEDGGGENTRRDSITDSRWRGGGVDSYDIIRLWSRKFNPFGSNRSPRMRGDRRREVRRTPRPQVSPSIPNGRWIDDDETEESKEPRDSDPYQGRSPKDDQSDVESDLLSSPEKDHSGGVPFEYKDPAKTKKKRRPMFLTEDYDAQFLSPAIIGGVGTKSATTAGGSRLSSVTEFTDVPPTNCESSNCATTSDDDDDDEDGCFSDPCSDV